MERLSTAAARNIFYGGSVFFFVIFALQLVFGLIGAVMYVEPNLIPTWLLPFSVVRMIHTNALIVWLLLGFFGSTYYLLPEETERELHSPLLAKIQFWVFFVAAVVAVVGYLFGNYDGRSYLEQPLYIKVGIVIVAQGPCPRHRLAVRCQQAQGGGVVEAAGLGPHGAGGAHFAQPQPRQQFEFEVVIPLAQGLEPAFGEDRVMAAQFIGGRGRDPSLARGGGHV